MLFKNYTNLIDAEINNGSKDYDIELYKKSCRKTNFLNFHILEASLHSKYQNLNFEVLNLNLFLSFLQTF